MHIISSIYLSVCKQIDWFVFLLHNNALLALELKLLTPFNFTPFCCCCTNCTLFRILYSLRKKGLATHAYASWSSSSSSYYYYSSCICTHARTTGKIKKKKSCESTWAFFMGLHFISVIEQDRRRLLSPYPAAAIRPTTTTSSFDSSPSPVLHAAASCILLQSSSVPFTEASASIDGWAAPLGSHRTRRRRRRAPRRHG